MCLDVVATLEVLCVSLYFTSPPNVPFTVSPSSPQAGRDIKKSLVLLEVGRLHPLRVVWLNSNVTYFTDYKCKEFTSCSCLQQLPTEKTGDWAGVLTNQHPAKLNLEYTETQAACCEVCNEGHRGKEKPSQPLKSHGGQLL
ncbi:hypothetical protein E2C01_016736 [Portunus trituberculatus]|uniref:Uncharacterized protein n=1 Tax=Portunus trituberculatus TaxID=210409 RepID=A0A5B7DRC3_PORTR|nr:hypothetical protein [Portunus trituberculatus]